CTFVAVLFLCVLCVPVGAVLLEVTFKGPVATISPTRNTLTIDNPLQYGCSYPAKGVPVCSYKPVNKSALTGTVPDSVAFTVFNVGDPVVATSTGGPGETWITVAKLFGSRPNEELVTDIVGDIGSIPTPLIGNYSLDATTVPDCSVCSGSTCAATSAVVKVKSDENEVLERTLIPGESLSYNGRNDGSSVYVRFVKGQALSTTCPGTAGMTGSQAISVYIVRVVPPVSSAQINIRTATTTRPDEALTPLPPTVLTTTAVPTTTRAGMLPLAVIGAIGLAGIVLVKKRR
ncbi:MAG: hypothetical protein WAK10_05065, partial [Methanoregula sp.]